MHSELVHHFLVTALALTLIPTLLHFFKIPTLIGFIFTGILIGPYALNGVDSIPAAQLLSEIGIVFLLFSLGLEVSIQQIKSLLRALLTLGAPQIGLTLIVFFLLGYLALDLNVRTSFVLAAALSLSSTAVVLKLLQERRETETPYGRVSVSVLLFQDLIALPLVAILPILASSHSQGLFSAQFAGSLFKLILFFVFSFSIGARLVPFVFKVVARTGSRELFFLCALSVTGVLGVLAESSGLSVSIGAFIAGMLIADSPYHQQALADLGPLRDLFLGVFFASVGMMLNPNLIAERPLQVIGLIVGIILLKTAVIYAIARLNRISHGVSFTSGLALSQVGEFSLVLMTSALALGLIEDQVFQLFLFVSVTSLLLTPVLIRFGLKVSGHQSFFDLVRRRKKISSKTEDEALVITARSAVVIGLGHAGESLLSELKTLGIVAVGVDSNLHNVERMNDLGFFSIFGDATRPEVLEAAGVNTAYLVIISVNSKSIASQIRSRVYALNSKVHCIIRTQYRIDVTDLRAKSQDQVIVAEDVTAEVLVKKVRELYALS